MDTADGDALERLAGFRSVFYQCLTARADALFELTDAVLCADGPVTSLPELSLAWVFRRGHGALYGALAEGSVDIAQLRRTLAGIVAWALALGLSASRAAATSTARTSSASSSRAARSWPRLNAARFNVALRLPDGAWHPRSAPSGLTAQDGRL